MHWWRRTLLSAAAVIAVCSAVPAQDAAQDLYQDVQLLLTVHKLQLTPAQTAWAADQATVVVGEREQLAALRAAIWDEDGKHFNAVNEAWIEAKSTPGRAQRAAENALEKASKAEADLRDLQAKAAQAFAGTLTEDQRALVESADSARARQERRARMGGIQTVGEYVAGKLDGVRDLMVDEFRMVGRAEAWATAEAILGTNSRDLDALTAKILDMMVQARSWTADRYAQSRQTTPQFVTQFLGIAEPDYSKYVSYDEVIALLGSERTAIVLGEPQADAGAGATPASADELASAERRALALNFVNSMGLTVQQTQFMLRPLQRIQAIIRSRDQARVAAVRSEPQFSALTNARQLLIAGEDVPAEALATIAAIETASDRADREMYIAIDDQMQTIADLMSSNQRARLDLTPPAAIRPERTARERATLQREITARIEDAVAMLDRVRTLDVFNFVTGRLTIVNEYLDRNGDRPLPGDAMEMTVAYTDQARMVPVEEWNARAYDLAAALVQDLGLMPSMRVGPRPGAISWSSLYKVLTAPEMLEVATELPKRRDR